ncbi:unnamed protein product [Ixodes hexagonus]
MTTLPLFLAKETTLRNARHPPPSPWSQGRVLRLGIFTGLLLLGAAMFALHVFYESRDGYTSVAEASSIPTGFLGFALVVASAGVLLVDVLVVLAQVARRPGLATSQSPVSSSMAEFFFKRTSSLDRVH